MLSRACCVLQLPRCCLQRVAKLFTAFGPPLLSVLVRAARLLAQQGVVLTRKPLLCLGHPVARSLLPSRCVPASELLATC